MAGEREQKKYLLSTQFDVDDDDIPASIYI